MDFQRGVNDNARNLVELKIRSTQFGVFGALAVHTSDIEQRGAPGSRRIPLTKRRKTVLFRA
jgi:hypothetical protein